MDSVVLNEIDRHVKDGRGARAANDRPSSLRAFQAASKLDPANIGIKLEIVNDLRELNRLDEAEFILAEILQKTPDNVGVLVSFAHIKRRQGNRTASLSLFEQAANLNPDNIALKIDVANDLRELNRARDAEAMLEAALKQNPQNVGVLTALAHAKRRQGDRTESLSYFKQAAILDPTNVGLKLEVAKDLRELNRLGDAEVAVTEILVNSPQNIGALTLLGQINGRQGNRAASLAYFEQAAALDSDNIGLRIEISRCLRELNRLDDADALLNEILQLAPRNTDVLVGLAQIKRRQRNHAASLCYFNQASVLDPDNIDLKIEIANDLRQLGRLEPAERTLSGLLEKSSNNVQVLTGMAHLKRRQGNRTSSLHYFEQAATFKPNNIELIIEVSNDLQELGRTADAEQSLKSALELNSGHAAAHAAYGILLRNTGRNAEALSELTIAANYEPNNSRFSIEIANTYRALDNIIDAENILAKLVDADPGNHHASIALASLLTDLHRLDEARAALEAACDLRPSMEIYLALGRLFRRYEDRHKSLQFFQSALSLAPSNPEALLESVDEYRARGDFVEAHRLLDEIAENGGQSLASALHRGRIFRDQGNNAAALNTFEEALRNFPSNWQARVEIAIEYRRIGRPKDSLRILSSMLDEDARNIRVIDQMIEHCRLAEEFDTALLLCRRVIELSPRRQWPYLRAADISAHLGDLTAARSFIDRAAHFVKEHPDIIAFRIGFLRRIKQYPEAENLYRSLPDKQKQLPSILVQGVHSAISLDELDLARERLSALQPQTTNTLAIAAHLKGKISETEWDHIEAVKFHKEGLRYNPGNAGAHWEIAKCQLLLLQPSAALDHLRHSVRLNASANILKGLSQNVSQNHLGQLIDEFSLDVGLLTELRSLEELDDNTRVEQLRDLVLNNPDHTPSAIMFLLALRKSGQLRLNNNFGSTALPKSIIQFWDDPSPPSEISALATTWRVQNPDYAYELFNKQGASEFLSENHSPDVSNAFRRAREPAQKADIFRLAYLATKGGFYADCDDSCLVKLDDLVPERATYVGYQEEYGTLGNNFIGVTAGHPVICTALDMAAEAVNRGDRDLVWFSTGPGLLTRAFALVAARTFGDILSRSAIFTVGQIQRAVGMHCPVAYKSTNRHWLNSSFLSNKKN